jgi:hypothetical protein
MNILEVGAGLGVAAAVWYAITIQKKRTNGPSLPSQRRRIAALDLAPVRSKATTRHGWDEDKARTLESEYRDFLILLAENAGNTISPWSDDLDLFWHEHILDTHKYAKDCAWIFGRFIQHDPHIGARPYHHEQTKRTTMALREAQLKAREERRAAAASAHATASDGFDVTTWGCGADGGTSHHSDHTSGGPSCAGTGEGDHGGHSCGGHAGGHSCGGHSCGGHSCGGHGCGGHGCGGGH